MITGYPFNGVQYSADSVAESFADLVTNGANVYQNANALKVVASTGMNVAIADGTGRIGGRLFSIENQTLAVAAGNMVERFDRVVVRMDATTTPGAFTVYVKSGTSTPPALERNTSGSIYEISLATLSVLNSTITIQDNRADPGLCGFVSIAGNEPYYPSGTIPENLWLYASFPNELSAAEKAAVEGNTTLMSKWNASNIAQNMFFCGSYVGNGATSRTIPTSRTPKFVFVMMEGTTIKTESTGGPPVITGGLAITGNPAADSVNTYIEIVSSGFSVKDNWQGSNQSIYAMLNATGKKYNYLWG